MTTASSVSATLVSYCRAVSYLRCDAEGVTQQQLTVLHQSVYKHTVDTQVLLDRLKHTCDFT